MSYVGLFVQVTHESMTPNQIEDAVRAICSEHMDAEVHVQIDEHSGECSPETCGSESGGHDQHALP